MIKKGIVIFNILLAVGLAFKLAHLQGALTDGLEVTETTREYQAPEVRRPKIQIIPEHANIFDIAGQQRETGEGAGNGTATANQESSADQLVTKHGVLRVQGIFTTGKKRWALISITPKALTSQTKEEFIKVGVGEQAGSYKIMDIEPQTVVLAGPEPPNTRLRIFKNRN